MNCVLGFMKYFLGLIRTVQYDFRIVYKGKETFQPTAYRNYEFVILQRPSSSIRTIPAYSVVCQEKNLDNKKSRSMYRGGPQFNIESLVELHLSRKKGQPHKTLIYLCGIVPTF